MKKKVLGIVLAAVLVLSLGLVFGAPVLASPVTMSVVSDTSVQIIGVYNKAEGGSSYVDLSGSPMNAVLAAEPTSYPSTYAVDAANSIWDNNVIPSKYFQNTFPNTEWIWETTHAEDPATVYTSGASLYDAAASTNGRVVVFQKTFTINGIPQDSVLHITADNCWEVWINGVFLARSATAKGVGWELTDLSEVNVGSQGWQNIGHVPIPAAMLNKGGNTLTILAGNEYYDNTSPYEYNNSGQPVFQASPYLQRNPGALIFDAEISYEEIEDVSIDIKPGSCPNPLSGGGVLPVAILGTEDFDVTQIDPETVELEGVSPLRWSFEDVATPFIGGSDPMDCMDCTTQRGDGYLDMTLKFDKKAIIEAVIANYEGPFEFKDCQELILTGELFGGTAFIGKDVVRIQFKVNGNGE